MRRKNIVLLGLALVLMLSMTACKKEKPKAEKVKDVMMEDVQHDDYKSIVSEEETNFTEVNENGETVFITEDSYNVELVKMFLAGYGSDFYNIDYKTVTGREPHAHFTEEFKEELEEDGDPQKFIDKYKKSKLVETFLGIDEVNYIKFNGEEAEVKVTFLMMYLEHQIDPKMGWKVGQEYHCPQTMRLKLVDGKWKIDEYLKLETPYRLVD